MSATKKSHSKSRVKIVGREPRMVFVNLAEHYGGTLTFAELAGALGGQEENPVVRAIVQLLRYQLGAARVHERVPAATAAERDFGAGGALATEEVIEWIYLLVKRDTDRPALAELRGQFAPRKEE